MAETGTNMDTHFFRWFPEIYPDDSLYNVMARYAVQMDISEFSTVARRFFGSKILKASILYFCQLEHLTESLPPMERFQTERIFNNHTGNPIMQILCNDKEYRKWKDITIEKSTKQTKLTYSIENRNCFDKALAENLQKYEEHEAMYPAMQRTELEQ